MAIQPSFVNTTEHDASSMKLAHHAQLMIANGIMVSNGHANDIMLSNTHAKGIMVCNGHANGIMLSNTHANGIMLSVSRY